MSRVPFKWQARTRAPWESGKLPHEVRDISLDGIVKYAAMHLFERAAEGRAHLSQGIIFSVGHVQAIAAGAVGHALRPIERGRREGAVAQSRAVAANLVQEVALQIAHHNSAARQFSNVNLHCCC